MAGCVVRACARWIGLTRLPRAVRSVASFSDPLPLGEQAVPIFLASQGDGAVKRALAKALPRQGIHGVTDLTQSQPNENDVGNAWGEVYQLRGAVSWEVCRNAQWVLGSAGSNFDTNLWDTASGSLFLCASLSLSLSLSVSVSLLSVRLYPCAPLDHEPAREVSVVDD